MDNKNNRIRKPTKADEINMKRSMALHKLDVKFRLLRCPFCGILPFELGKSIDYKQGGLSTKVRHPDTRNCALDNMQCSNTEWNKRHT